MSIRAGARAPTPQKTDSPKSKTALVAAVVHELIRDGSTWESYADLVDVLKARLAQLRIAYDADAITNGIALVERSRPVLAPLPRVERGPREPEWFDTSRRIGRDDAAAILQRLGVNVRSTT